MSRSRTRPGQAYRARLKERGLARYEVQGLERDRELIRLLARKLVEEGPEAQRLRAAVAGAVVGAPPRTGGIVAALRRSPLAHADLDLSREHGGGRDVDV